MAVDDYDGLTVAIGEWRYDGKKYEVIEIVAFDCDYFFDRLPADDGRKNQERFSLNDDGLLYYLKAAGDVLLTAPFDSASAAKDWADNQPWSPIKWRERKMS